MGPGRKRSFVTLHKSRKQVLQFALFQGTVTRWKIVILCCERGGVLTARDLESALLARCAAAAREAAPSAQDQREANVFRLAATVVQSQFPRESIRLMLASEQYFTEHPTERLVSSAVVRNGWVQSLPRLRDMLTHRLS